MNYLEFNSLLSMPQFGFCKGRSVEDQLLMTYAEVVDAVDRGLTADMNYLHFSMAFDVVSHSIILKKLEMLGDRGKILIWSRELLFEFVSSHKDLSVLVDSR